MDEEQQNSQIQSLKNLLTQILYQNTAYDCLPLNSSMNSIDKSTSLHDAVNILIHRELQQLLIWDSEQSDWIWMFTLVDAIRFLTHALKSFIKHGHIGIIDTKFSDFTDFQQQKHQQNGQMISIINKCSHQQIDEVILRLENKSIYSIINQITGSSTAKEYIRLKSVLKQSKLSLVIMNMSFEKIHRVLVADTESNTYISVINLKDIFFYILRIANQSQISYYSSIDIHSLLLASQAKNIEVQDVRPLWQAFQIMTDRAKSLWINVVDAHKRFKGMLFREDFRDIFRGWHIDYMWMSVGDFIQLKKSKQKGNIPQFRYFEPTQCTQDILWKMVMTKRNAIVWVDEQFKVHATIGLMEIFRLYVT